jgi:hypothetical protein
MSLLCPVCAEYSLSADNATSTIDALRTPFPSLRLDTGSDDETRPIPELFHGGAMLSPKTEVPCVSLSMLPSLRRDRYRREERQVLERDLCALQLLRGQAHQRVGELAIDRGLREAADEVS